MSFQYAFNDRFAANVGLGFEMKGTQNESGSFYNRYNYLLLPVKGKMNFGAGKNFFVEFGPYVGYLLTNTVLVEGTKYHDDGSYKKVDFGISFGAGYRIVLAQNLGMTIKISNNLGLINIQKQDSENKKFINSISILIGVVYCLPSRQTARHQ